MLNGAWWCSAVLVCGLLPGALLAAPDAPSTAYGHQPICEPDPWLALCGNIPPSLMRAEEERHALVMRLLIGSLNSAAGRHLLHGILEDNRASILAHVGLAREVFLETVRSANGFSALEHAWMEANVRTCSQDVTLWPTNQLNGASIQRVDATWITSPRATGQAACGLRLPPKYVFECRDGTVNCYRMIFHEMAHFINACRFLQMSTTTEDRALKRQLESLADRLHGRHACLSTQAWVEEGQPNACMFADPLTERELRYCERSDRTREGFPSQWEEAEADAWSALALARTFLRSGASPSKARTDLTAALQQYCVEVQFHPLAFPDPSTTPLPSSASADWLKTPWWSALRFLDRTVLHCKQRGVASPRAAWPAHPSWDLRWNRYLLRNPDLRVALGCRDEPTTRCPPL